MGRLAVFTLSFLLSSTVLARPAQKMRPSLAREMKEKKRAIAKLTGDLESLEKSLGHKNRKYVRVVEKRRGIEEQIFLLNKSLMEREGEIKSEILESKQLLGKIVISEIDGDEAAELLASKVMRHNLKNRLSGLEGQIEQIKALKSEMQYLSGRLNEYTELEAQLSSLIELMERQKNSKTHAYWEEKRVYRNLSQKMKKKRRTSPRLVASKAKLQKALGLFVPPLASHKKLEYGKKGVTYIYSKRQPVRATRRGKVVHSDTLSTFGHVVMIDHGAETRSILLGPFETQVKKGVQVAEGEILGYTVEYPDSSGKFYFEVRKKNRPQNTIHLLDQNWTPKEHLAKSTDGQKTSG